MRQDDGGLRFATDQVEYYLKWQGISQMLMERDGVAVSHGCALLLDPRRRFREVQERNAFVRRRVRTDGREAQRPQREAHASLLQRPGAQHLIMARTKKGNPVHGWVVLDKPAGMTSTQAVGAVKRLFEAQKAGHAGTLDPLATGILPIALGEATKTVPFAVDGEKAYRFTVRFGAETDTDDAEGKVVRTSDALAAAPGHRGDACRASPARSSRCRRASPPSRSTATGLRSRPRRRGGGARAARGRHRGSAPHRDAGRGTAVFEADCGKGTYVRALARDMGRALACFGHVIELRRTRVGAFDEAASVTLDELQAAAQAGGDGRHAACLMPVEAALDDLPGLSVGPGDAASLARGQAVLVRGRDAPVMAGAAYAHFKGRILALGELEKGAFRPTRVFNFG